MKRLLLPALVAAASLLLCACNTISLNPLSPPETAQPDPRLLGDWHHSYDHQISRITAGKGGWMHVDTFPEKPGDKVESSDFFPTVIGKSSFLNLKQTTQDEKGRDVPCYILMRYEVNDAKTKVLFWMMDDAAAAAVVRSGKLKGRVHEGKDMSTPPKPDFDITLTDSPKNLAAYLRSSGASSLFVKKPGALVR